MSLNVKLSDFGMAKMSPDGVSQPRATSFSTSDVYVAPEVLAAQSYGTQADMWSLGITLYHCLTGHLPFQSGTTLKMNVCQEILSGSFLCDALSSAQFPEHLSFDALRFLERLLRVDPNERLNVIEALNHRWLRGNDVGTLHTTSAKMESNLVRHPGDRGQHRTPTSYDQSEPLHQGNGMPSEPYLETRSRSQQDASGLDSPYPTTDSVLRSAQRQRPNNPDSNDGPSNNPWLLYSASLHTPPYKMDNFGGPPLNRSITSVSTTFPRLTTSHTVTTTATGCPDSQESYRTPLVPSSSNGYYGYSKDNLHRRRERNEIPTTTTSSSSFYPYSRSQKKLHSTDASRDSPVHASASGATALYPGQNHGLPYTHHSASTYV